MNEDNRWRAPVSGVTGYRKVDGRNTRWRWDCLWCDDHDFDFRRRSIAQDAYQEHRERCRRRP